SHAIQAGKEGFASEGMTNVQLSVGRAEDLSQFKDRSFDVVFTDAVLIYVKRGDIQRVIKEMMRIVRGGIVLVECHDFEHQPGDRQGLGVFKRGLWVRDYTTLLKQFVPENQINITKLTKEVWPPDGWGRNGALIEVTLQSSSSIAAKRGAKDNPLVSVITPVLNGVKYLEECIQSVLNQDYPYIEHIIVDGGSTDGTVDILSGYQAKYPDRIRFVSEPGTGVGEALNRGLGMAKGGIFGWVNADDFYEPGAVPTVVEFFKANPDAYFVFGGCNFINEKGEITGKYATKDFDLKKMINKANYIPQPSAFFRREVIERVGWFETLIGSDRDYWIRAGMVFPIHRIEKVLSSFRVHAGSATTGSSKEIRRRHLRADYITTRRFGGSIFSRYCREYYRFVIIEGLRPVLGFTYPLIKRVLER
ncbi:MAG: glycosyltransferase, partial [Dehalococcoidales bacterium]|nr:glycosyltransferase [Dehalococcoidales bacterium]